MVVLPSSGKDIINLVNLPFKALVKYCQYPLKVALPSTELQYQTSNFHHKYSSLSTLLFLFISLPLPGVTPGNKKYLIHLSVLDTLHQVDT